jgi:hypothetical protein
VVTSKAKAGSAELAPEIVQVIAVVAEIMLERAGDCQLKARRSRE